MFVDHARIHLSAGDGGDGCISFRREKYVPRGGPDGGDGGRGGHIYLVAEPSMTTLLDLRYKPNYTTKRGTHGGGNQCTGADAEDLYIKVPLGTTVSTEDGELLADLTEPGQTLLAAQGGKGGKGNQHFASSTNKAPRKFEYGGDGEKITLILELKMIADIGLVGLPNAGKSTLLSKLTAATPKIASYPFTTIHPNLGVLIFDEETRCVIADIPGLIEGAHRGAGLGDRFLRHIERTELLVHLVAPPDEPPYDDFEKYEYAWQLVNQELHSYGTELRSKPQIACLTKIDLLSPDQVEALREKFAQGGTQMIAISSESGEGLDALKATLREYIVARREAAEHRASDSPDLMDEDPGHT